MNTKHTPGPWRTLAKNPRKIVTAETRHAIVASCYTTASKGPGLRTKQSAGSPPRDESEANARLISAAPCLLTHLARAISQFDALENNLSEADLLVIDEAKAAIAKATGKEVA